MSLGNLLRTRRLLERTRPQGAKRSDKVLQLMYELRCFGGGYPPRPQSILLDSTKTEKFFQQPYTLIGREITIQVMTVTEVSPTHEDAVHPFLESA